MMTSETPHLTEGTPVRLIAAAASLWRVRDPAGRIIGHLSAREDTDGVRYCARRFQTTTGAFRDLGEFWSADAAVECLRYAS